MSAPAEQQPTPAHSWYSALRTRPAHQSPTAVEQTTSTWLNLPLGGKNPSFAGGESLFTGLCVCLLNILIPNACRRFWGNISLRISTPCFTLINELVFLKDFPVLHLLRFLLSTASLCSCRYCPTPGFVEEILCFRFPYKFRFAVLLGEVTKMQALSLDFFHLFYV